MPSTEATGSNADAIALLEAKIAELRAQQRPVPAQVNGVERSFEWESRGFPWRLFAMAMGRVGRSIFALALIYWCMGIRREFLMSCDGRRYSLATVCYCEYSKTFLRVFALLGLNISLTVAMRLIVQERIYYGMLKQGGLIDFECASPVRDPLMWLLVVSLAHGVSHFVLKFYNSKAWLTPTWNDDIQELSQISGIFLMPSFIFMMIFIQSSDIENDLIPLNKYFEEDWVYARHMLGSITPMDENTLRAGLQTGDFVGEAEEPTIKAVYQCIIRAYPTFADATSTPHLFFREMWPAQILVDARLQDDESFTFRIMFVVFLALTFLIHTTTIVLLAFRAWKDLYVDWWQRGHIEDLLAFFVEFAHIILIAWLLRLCVERGQICRMSTCCSERTKVDSP